MANYKQDAMYCDLGSSREFRVLARCFQRSFAFRVVLHKHILWLLCELEESVSETDVFPALCDVVFFGDTKVSDGGATFAHLFLDRDIAGVHQPQVRSL